MENSDLAVEAKEQQHDEEEDGPQGRQRHHGHSFGVSYEGQAGTWGKTERGRGKGGETGINIFRLVSAAMTWKLNAWMDLERLSRALHRQEAIYI